MKLNKSSLRGFLSLFIAAVFLFTAASCGSGTSSGETTDTGEPAGTAAETEEEGLKYTAETEQYGGYEFRFLNVIDDLWGNSAVQILDFVEEPADKLSEAIYVRNRKIEEELDIKILVTNKLVIFDLDEELNRSVLAGEDEYDAAFVCNNSLFNTAKSVVNLHDVQSLALDQVWWDPSYVESMTINGNLLGAMGYISFWGQIFVASMQFNRSMMADHNLELPYDLVREGKWTFDRMYEYMTEVVNLNGDDSFTPDMNGTCIYGFVGGNDEPALTLIEASGAEFIMKDKNGFPQVNENLDALVDAYRKLFEVLKGDGYFALSNTSELMGTDHIFVSQGRALFSEDSIECLISSVYRESELEYGVLPLPKYDENIAGYRSPLSQYGMAVTVPVTNKDTERTGKILDYMSFCGYTDVYPVIQEMMCYKGIRDEDSIEMLDVIFQSKYADAGYLCGWTQNLYNNIVKGLINKDEEIVSKIEKEKEAVQKKIDKYFEA